MKRDAPGWRVVGRCAAGVGALPALGAALVYASLSGTQAGTARDRGAYLVDALAACAGCHTPRAPGHLGPALSGGNRFGPPQAGVFAPNITPDKATGIGSWTDGQIADAIRHGVRPDGTRIGPPMPQTAYSAMTDADVAAIVAYLRSVPPVTHAVPASNRRVPATLGDPTAMARGARAAAYGPASESPVIARGRYIATALSHCTECHTPVAFDSPDLARTLDAGGRPFHTPDGVLVAPGIRASDLAGFSDAALAAIITRGVRPDGNRLRGPMPVKSYAGFRKTDLDALIAFLRSPQRVGP